MSNEVNSDPRAQEVNVSTAVLDENSNVAVQNEINSPINKLGVSPAFLNNVIWPTDSPRKSTRRNREIFSHVIQMKKQQ